MKLNNIINKYYKNYEAYVNTVQLNTYTTYIYSIYNYTRCILRSEYIILGSLSRSKNIWMWYDQSPILDKLIVNNISEIRRTLLTDTKKLNNKDKEFIKNDHCVITISELYDIFNIIDMRVEGDIFIQNKDTQDRICVILLTKILQNNIDT